MGSTWSGPAEADDRAVHGRVAQGPGDGDGAGRHVVALGHRLQALHQREVLGELRLAEPRRRGLRQSSSGRPSIRSRVIPPAEHPGPHRRVDDHPDALALGEGQDRRPRRRGRSASTAAGGSRPARSPAPGAAAATSKLETPMWRTSPSRLRLGEGRPALLDLLVGDREVDLVQVDRVDPEPREAALELAPDGVAAQAVHRRPPRPLGLAALGEHVRALVERRRSPGRRPPRSGRSRTARRCRSS